MGGLRTLPPPSAGLTDVDADEGPATNVVPDMAELAAGPPTNVVPDAGDLAAAARAYQNYRSQAGPDDTPAAGPFADLHRADPKEALRLAEAAARLPGAGDDFAGFTLGAELGRGAFGRVFLARQRDLADRTVVLKISANIRAEAHTLARLLHTNIVPVYSAHKAGAFEAVCMPYCGAVTLHHILRRFRTETLPNSGRHLVTLLHSSAATDARSAASAGSTGPASTGPASAVGPVSRKRPAPALPAAPAATHAILDLLQGLSYVDAVLWIGARLADGLGHAHDRGILHRDLKPANVLLTDEGQPMLLDFNLAADTAENGLAEAARLGGTLPYMAPEHLESFAGTPRVVDARADIYALGLILFELLTRDYPFPIYGRARPEHLRLMIADRQTVPALRDKNPAVSPAVEAIVRKCLAPAPADRYPSAHALLEDLERQLRHQPLKHVREPSLKERARKWARRNPRLASAGFLGTCALVLILAVSGLAVQQHQRRMGLEARAALGDFRTDAQRFQLSLTGLPDDDRKPLIEAVEVGRQTLGRYPAADGPKWDTDPLVKHLGADDRTRLKEETGVLLLMLAHVTAKASAEPAAAEEALQLNDRAAVCFPADEVPPAVRSQRAGLLTRLGRAAETEPLRTPAAAPQSARDLYLAGWDLARDGKYAPAVPLLEDATRRDPQSVWAWFLLGRCHDGLGRDADAVACYGACLALHPDAHQVWYSRGLAHLRRGDFPNARADFDKALDLCPGLADAHFNRGLAKQSLKDDAGAEADFTAALNHGSLYTRVYFVRAEVRARLGDAAGAEADRKDGLALDPVEESCWTARGFARLGTDPTSALADFDRALDRNPDYRPALANKAYVLADVLNRPAEAVAVLDRAIQAHPGVALLRSSRAVYLARLGRRDAAHRAAEDALELSPDPATRYQIAGVYALTSKTHPADRADAFRLLTGALKAGYGFQHLDGDPDLAAVRGVPEFDNLVAAARALRPTPK